MPFLLACSLLSAPALFGTEPSLGREGEEAADPSLHFADESSVAWVLVPVVVRGSAGQVRNLEADDFRLTVDRLPVSVMSFEAGPEAPIRLIYLQDLSGSMANAGKLDASREALRCFLGRSRSGDELALMTFASGSTRLDVAFTAETERLERALGGWQGYGTTALHDAVARLPEVRADPHVKQAAVLVTDGGDNASTLAPARAREILRQAELPVYVLDLKTHEPRLAPAERDTFSHLLRLLALATGGKYRELIGNNRVGRACAEITEDLRHQYVLGFQTQGSGARDYREIGVEVVGKKRFRLTHRRGYLGLPPLDPPPLEPPSNP